MLVSRSNLCDAVSYLPGRVQALRDRLHLQSIERVRKVTISSQGTTGNAFACSGDGARLQNLAATAERSTSRRFALVKQLYVNRSIRRVPACTGRLSRASINLLVKGFTNCFTVIELIEPCQPHLRARSCQLIAEAFTKRNCCVRF